MKNLETLMAVHTHTSVLLSDGFEKRKCFVKKHFEAEEGFERAIQQKKSMKILASILMMLALWMILGSVVNAGTIPCITEWTIPVDADGTGAGTTIKLPIPSDSANSYTVDWGDGTTNSYTTTAFPTHTYTNITKTVYTVKVTGTTKSFGYYDQTNPTATNSYSNYYTFTKYLTGLMQWGELEATHYGFSYCTNLGSTIPEPTENSFSNVRNMSCLFLRCSKLSGTIPNNLFINALYVDNFFKTFDGCFGLSVSISPKLFVNTNVFGFTFTFNNCTGLTGSIPAELFANTPKVNRFYRYIL